MGLNPFKDADLIDLQENSSKFIREVTDRFSTILITFFKNVRKKGNERITLMFIPHSEKKIINFHISIFTITLVSSILTITVVITSFLIVNHASTVKEVSKLKSYDVDSSEQIKYFQTEITKLGTLFNNHLKTDFELVYGSLFGVSNAHDLWARGGGSEEDGSFLPEVQEEAGNPNQEILDLQQMETELTIMRDKMVEIRETLEKRKKIIENTPSIWPANGFIISGMRNSSDHGNTKFSEGIDIASFPGAEIRATAPGTVETVVWDTNYGLRIVIRHKFGFTTFYNHCQRVAVKEGQNVSKGEIIGFVGKTGKTTRHIVHYQIKIGTDYVDPMPYLNKITSNTD
ncbi:MAG: peptidoglycan DD-metalloendopeptidase family protein [Spirochaetes bacterium]|nr:peptidoglycan DD-metalloendopeptidase family protein [Spirochaetota bacterium]